MLRARVRSLRTPQHWHRLQEARKRPLLSTGSGPREHAATVPDAAVDATRVNCARVHPERLQPAVELLAEEDVGLFGVSIGAFPPIEQEFLGVPYCHKAMGDAVEWTTTAKASLQMVAGCCSHELNLRHVATRSARTGYGTCECGTCTACDCPDDKARHRSHNLPRADTVSGAAAADKACKPCNGMSD